MCDLAEVFLMERLERRVLAQRQVAAAAGLDLPDVGAAQEQLRAMLEAPAEVVDVEQEDLLVALGLR